MKIYPLLLALSLSMVASAQVPTTGLIGYYPFSGNANDFSGNQYHGNVVGPSLTLDRFGNFNSAYHFDGVNDYINLSQYVNHFNYLAPATVSVWVRTNTNVAQSLFGISDNSSNQQNISAIHIGRNTTGTLSNELIVSAYQNLNIGDKYIAGYVTTQECRFIDNAWHHIVGVYDGHQTKIYLDNTLISLTCDYGTNNGHFGNLTNPLSFYIGSRFSGSNGNFVNGDLDDIRFYNVALDSIGIAQLYYENTCVPMEPITFTDTVYIPVYDTLVINFNPTSVNSNIWLNTIKLYPNPASDVLYIESNDNSFGYQLKIVNAVGQEVYNSIINQNIVQVDLNTWTGQGTYFVYVLDNQNVIIEIKKIIIQ